MLMLRSITAKKKKNPITPAHPFQTYILGVDSESLITAQGSSISIYIHIYIKFMKFYFHGVKIYLKN